jgi:hypothetical protein
MAIFELGTPSEDHRLITVNGLNLPEFPADDDLAYRYTRLPVINALGQWVDQTLASNQVTGQSGEGWQVPNTLWVPTEQGSTARITREQTVTVHEEEEPITYMDDEMHTVRVTTTTTRRSISTPPKNISTRLDDQFLQESALIRREFSSEPPQSFYTRKVGSILEIDAWCGPLFENIDTGKKPNGHAANRMALKAAKNMLGLLGYSAEAFDTSSQTYGDYIASLK